MQVLMIGIPDPTKKIILRSNKSAIRHPHPKILTLRPPPTPCPEKKTPNKQNQKHHLGCPQTATLKGLKQAEVQLMSCQQPTKKTPGKFTLLKQHCQQKIVTKSAQFLLFLLKAKQLVNQFPTFIFIFLKLAPSFLDTLFCWLVPKVKICTTANEKMESFATHNLHLFERNFPPSFENSRVAIYEKNHLENALYNAILPQKKPLIASSKSCFSLESPTTNLHDPKKALGDPVLPCASLPNAVEKSFEIPQ